MEFLFEDENIAVCIKPVGVLSQESADKNDMVNILRKECKSEIYPVHRLDKAVGGVMVFAKTQKSATNLSKQIAEHEFTKEYYAAVGGIMEKENDVFEDLLFKDSSKNKTFVVKRMRKGVKKAKLSYKVIAAGTLGESAVSLVKIRLFTGRSHQIRVQFASRKHPLLGDGKYGDRNGSKNIELWSHKIVFKNPASGEVMSFSADPLEGTMMHSLLNAQK